MSHNVNWSKKNISCPLCQGNAHTVLGIRGNREYFDADPNAEPHIFTNVVQCDHCGYIFTNPMIIGMEHLEKSHYNDPERYQKDEEGKIPDMFKKRLEYISKFKTGKFLLDVGAGKGEFLNEAKKKNWQIKGIEPSPEFCRFAKEKFGIDVINGLLGVNGRIDKHQFDLVTLNHVLEHVDQPGDLLRIIKSYLKEDGIIFIEVPNCGSILLKLADLYFRIRGLKWSSRLSPLHPPFHKYGYTKKSLAYILNKSGYQVVDVHTYTGSDRGYKKINIGPSIVLRNIASGIINVFGNRELLCIVAKVSK